MTDDTKNPEIVPVQKMDSTTFAEMDAQAAIAIARPRSLKTFKDELMTMATLDEETAEECFYSMRRQGTSIDGPSVRLAEMAVASWGNLRAGFKINGVTDDGKHISATGYCHDMEKNSVAQVEVRRRITRKDGSVFGDDMIAVTGMAAGAIAYRNAVWKIVPKAFIKPAYRAARKTAIGDAASLTERREKVFTRLQGLSPLITEEKILAAVERPSIDDVTTDDLGFLIGLGTSIKEGIPVEEAFPEPEGPKADDVVAGAGKDTKRPTKRTTKKTTKKADDTPPKGSQQVSETSEKADKAAKEAAAEASEPEPTEEPEAEPEPEHEEEPNFPTLDPDQVDAVKALCENEPEVTMDELKAKLGKPLEEFAGEPDESPKDFFKRVLREVQELKKAKTK